MRVEGDRIAAVGTDARAGDPADDIIEADGRVLLPGFVDAHTHALWAGSRADELERRRRGESYLDILRPGGGILADRARGPRRVGSGAHRKAHPRGWR